MGELQDRQEFAGQLVGDPLLGFLPVLGLSLPQLTHLVLEHLRSLLLGLGNLHHLGLHLRHVAGEEERGHGGHQGVQGEAVVGRG